MLAFQICLDLEDATRWWAFKHLTLDYAAIVANNLNNSSRLFEIPELISHSELPSANCLELLQTLQVVTGNQKLIIATSNSRGRTFYACSIFITGSYLLVVKVMLHLWVLYYQRIGFTLSLYK